MSELCRKHTPAAISSLVSIMSDKGALPAARVSAASAILDRGWGKPPQAITASVQGPLAESFAEILEGIDGSKMERFKDAGR